MCGDIIYVILILIYIFLGILQCSTPYPILPIIIIATCPRSFSTRISATATVNGSSKGKTSSYIDTSRPGDLKVDIRLNTAEKARTVSSVCTSGTLCTMSYMDGIEGAPFGSYVDYVLDDNGNPVLLMNEMSNSTQVFTITHIPQVAAKGENHIKVFKKTSNFKTITVLKKLNRKEREDEIALMLSGKKMTISAIEHARELLD